jgi:hypothetical protein
MKFWSKIAHFKIYVVNIQTNYQINNVLQSNYILKASHFQPFL